nr:uracil-DNA glycosylase family protein [Pseudoalteromonas sp. MMG010]
MTRVSQCVICKSALPLEVRPIIQFNANAKILIAGQAPGLKAHHSNKPFTDASGERLKAWLGLSDSEFYDASKVAILPIGFCYPGRGSRGDLPPRKECAQAWRAPLLAQLTKLKLTIILGKHAQAYHLPQLKNKPLTELVKSWRDHWPKYCVLPHPSPRNNIWLSKNPWFEHDVLPSIKQRVSQVIKN